LDALVGNSDGNTLSYRNTGSATAPAFAAPSANPFGLGDVGLWASPTFVDLDGDGDMDALLGNRDGNTLFYLNNAAPTDLALSASSVNENVAANTVIGTLTSTDLNSADIFTYSLVSGTGATDNSVFTINGNQLQINSSPDFETQSSYNIRVRTTDQGGLSFEKVLTINVNNLNEVYNLTTTPQTDSITTEGLNDTITSTYANLQQNDKINGGGGSDTLIITGGTVTDSLSIDAGNSTNQVNIPGATITNFERFDLSGFLGTVSFTGYTGNNWIKSGTGNDLILGGVGMDDLRGGEGNDRIYGYNGNDVLRGENIGDKLRKRENCQG
jgi:Ca2+-binding RTX toxin-like protein